MIDREPLQRGANGGRNPRSGAVQPRVLATVLAGLPPILELLRSRSQGIPVTCVGPARAERDRATPQEVLQKGQEAAQKLAKSGEGWLGHVQKAATICSPDFRG